VSYRSTNRPANHYFDVEIAGNQTDAQGLTTITGTITNANTTAADDTHVIAEFRDARGLLVDTALVHPNTGGDSHRVGPGETVSFELKFFDFVSARLTQPFTATRLARTSPT
jgi:hypothetical protein